MPGKRANTLSNGTITDGGTEFRLVFEAGLIDLRRWCFAWLDRVINDTCNLAFAQSANGEAGNWRNVHQPLRSVSSRQGRNGLTSGLISGEPARFQAGEPSLSTGRILECMGRLALASRFTSLSGALACDSKKASYPADLVSTGFFFA